MERIAHGVGGYKPGRNRQATYGCLMKSLGQHHVPSWLSISVEFADSDMQIFHFRVIESGRHSNSKLCLRVRQISGARQ